MRGSWRTLKRSWGVRLELVDWVEFQVWYRLHFLWLALVVRGKDIDILLPPGRWYDCVLVVIEGGKKIKVRLGQSIKILDRVIVL